MTTSVLDRAQLLEQLDDETLYEMAMDYPTINSMDGYSSAARLTHAMNVSALKLELKRRSLVP